MSEQIKRAIIIAAGEGKRLRPITETTPKPLVSVNGIRIIDTIINALKEEGIHKIYIVVGYQKEKFREVYGNDPSIHFLDNPHYREGNNITSMYIARDLLPESVVIEGDILVKNKEVFNKEIKESCYCVEKMSYAPEWAVKTVNGHIVSCRIEGDSDAGRIWGISMWTKRDGGMLAEMIRRQVEDKKDWSVYWDEIALFQNLEKFNIGIREVHPNDLIEIDTVRELADLDSSYLDYCEEV